MIKVGTDCTGIGAPELALLNLFDLVYDGGFHSVFACEKDRFARQTYEANFHTDIMYEDITERDHTSTPYVDLYMAGFPCQAFSISGLRLGFDDVRGTIFFHCAKYIELKRPKCFVLENVKGLLSHDKKNKSQKFGNTFQTILNLLSGTINGQQQMGLYDDNLGYNVYYKVLNTKDYGLPQNRERIFIVGIRPDVDLQNFRFPKPEKLTVKLKDLLETEVDEKYYLSGEMLNYLFSRSANFNNGKINFKHDEDIVSTITASSSKLDVSDNILVVNNRGRLVEKDIVMCLYANYHKGMDNHAQRSMVLVPDLDPFIVRMQGRNPDNPNDRSKGAPTEQRLEKNIQGIANTITTITKDNLLVEPVVSGHYRIRKLTPLECGRIQGFPDSFLKPVSDTQLYRQFGNSISETVIRALLSNVLKSVQL